MSISSVGKGAVSMHGDDFVAGTRFLPELKFPKAKAKSETSSSTKSEMAKGSNPQAKLKFFEKGARPSKETMKNFTQDYNQTLQYGEKLMKSAPNSRERDAGYRIFNQKAQQVLGSAKKLGMSKDNLSKLKNDLFKPLIREKSPLLKGSATGQARTVANRYGMQDLSKKLNADHLKVSQLVQQLMPNFIKFS